MGLNHRFAVIKLDACETSISEDMDFIEIPDFLMQYMGDSFQWIMSSWNGEDVNKGFSYYGFSIVQGAEIVKLKKIVELWMNLFESAPSKFYLTGNYLLDEHRHEKMLVDRNSIVGTLNQWCAKCELAIQNRYGLLHNGI